MTTDTCSVDLLNSRKVIQVLEDSLGVTQLVGALEHQVENKESLLGYIESAASFRKSAQTLKNDDSSRSHAICRIRIKNPALPAAEDGLLYMVDLAGSEAARDVSNHGADRMRETREINASLSVLKDCIRGRAEADAKPFTVVKGRAVAAKKPHVPFRQSTLTKVLKHLFDAATTRSCKTAVVACVNPSFLDVGASKNTLRYAETLRVLVPKSNEVQYNPAVPVTWSNERLREWIDRNVSTRYTEIVNFRQKQGVPELRDPLVRNTPNLLLTPCPHRIWLPNSPPPHPRVSNQMS